MSSQTISTPQIALGALPIAAALVRQSDGIIVGRNSAFDRLFAEVPETAISAMVLSTDPDQPAKPWWDICPSISRGLWQRILSDREPPHVETTIGARPIELVHVRQSSDIVAVFGIDLTTLRRTERELQIRTEELEEVARFPDLNPGTLLRMDRDANVLLANIAAREVFGDSLVGRCWRDVCSAVNLEVWRRILDGTEIISIETNIGELEFVFQHRNDPHSGMVFCFGTDVTSRRQAERTLRQSEKMATLGTLAAGIAHELNNPAAATRRAADQLQEAFGRLEQAQLLRDRVTFSEVGREILERVAHTALNAAKKPSALDPMARSDLEGQVEKWLEARAFVDSWELAPALVSAGLDPKALDEIAAKLQDEALVAAVSWIGAAFPVYSLTYEIGNGTARISEIVGALKGYSYLGQAPVQEINLQEGIDNTLIILRSKLKQGIAVKREYAPNLPRIMAHGSELNQVWTNILDNAADALGGKGTITIRTRVSDPWAIVEIEDDGPGIPQEIQSRIFDPFFTTKELGKGTGLGLSTTYTIVRSKHQGAIDVESRPGMTRFTVKLPLTHTTGEMG